MLKNLTIKSKLIFVISFLSLSLVGGGVMGIYFLGLSNSTVKSMYEDKVMKLSELDSLVRLMNRNQLLLAQAVSGKMAAFPDDDAKTAKYVDEAEQQIQDINKIQKQLLARQWAPSEKEQLDKLLSARLRYGREAFQPALAALRAHDFQQATEILQGPLLDRFAELTTIFNSLITMQVEASKSAYDHGQEHYELVKLLAIMLTVAGVLIAAIMAWWLLNSITRPLQEAVNVAKRVAAGDLSQHIHVNSHDETGVLMQAMKEMNDGLHDIVSQVRTGTEAIALASQEIAAGNLDLSNRTESQAHALSMTAAATAQMTTAVEQNTESAHHAQKVAATTRDIAEAGGQTMTEVVSTMAEISTSSKKIVDIISVIEGIAFQTNILALNAAVEAARAGEQGRGFAVVAGEVRSLAQRSSAAAKEIKTLINHSVLKVKDGSRLVEEAGENMEEILTVVGLFTDLLDTIYNASSQQSSGIVNINKSVSEMDEMTQQNAALVEQAAAAAQSMQDQAMNLEQAVSVFKLAKNEKSTHQFQSASYDDEPSASKAAPKKSTDIEGVGEEWDEF
ncbi:methyl-accepting chemotaxis protein [Sulfuriferula thiophila]|uniref:methyl-accepting chemotaxis protein n=1 Tax=Sulfuriferula thiophila TaxID=1781211 RepID=UPI000F6148D3|nr:methyl-accepting chemotaxis protein [Sulfuriferula thiophila]